MIHWLFLISLTKESKKHQTQEIRKYDRIFLFEACEEHIISFGINHHSFYSCKYTWTGLKCMHATDYTIFYWRENFVEGRRFIAHHDFRSKELRDEYCRCIHPWLLRGDHILKEFTFGSWSVVEVGAFVANWGFRTHPIEDYIGLPRIFQQIVSIFEKIMFIYI